MTGINGHILAPIKRLSIEILVCVCVHLENPDAFLLPYGVFFLLLFPYPNLFVILIRSVRRSRHTFFLDVDDWEERKLWSKDGPE